VSDAAIAIHTANSDFMSVFRRADPEGMAALYTDDGTLLPPGGDAIQGRDGIAAFWRSVMDMGIASAELETVELDEQGNTAIEVGRYRLGTAEGKTADQGKYLVVWKRADGAWKLHRDVWNTSLA